MEIQKKLDIETSPEELLGLKEAKIRWRGQLQTRLKHLIVIVKKQDIKTSPEELLCKMAMKKCLQEREQLINQLHNQYNNRKKPLKA